MAAQFSSRWRWNKCPPAFKRTGPIEFTGFIIVKELGSEENRPRNSDKSSSCLVSFDGRRNHSRRRGLLGTESWVAWRCLWTNQKYIYIDSNQNNKTSVPLQRKKSFQSQQRLFRRPTNMGKSVRDTWKRARQSRKQLTIRVLPKCTENFSHLCAKCNRNAQNSLHSLRSSTQRECTWSDKKKT